RSREIEIEVDTREGVRVKRGSRAGPAGVGCGEGSGRVCPDITPPLSRFASKRLGGSLSLSLELGGAFGGILQSGQGRELGGRMRATGSLSAASLYTLPSTKVFGAATWNLGSSRPHTPLLHL